METTNKLTINEIFNNIDTLDFGESGDYFVNNWDKVSTIKKDFNSGDILKVLSIKAKNEKEFTIHCEKDVSFHNKFKKEKKYFSLINPQIKGEDSLYSWMNTEDFSEFISDRNISVCVKKEPNGTIVGSLYDAHLHSLTEEFFRELKGAKNSYNAIIKSKNNGGFLVSIEGVDAFLPGSLAAANKIENFDTYIGKEVTVMVEDFLRESQTFIVSHKKYINSKLNNEIDNLDEFTLYKGKITGFSNFGVFIEFKGQDVFLTGLLYSTEMTEDSKNMFENRTLKVQDEIEFYVKEINKRRIILTQRLDSKDKPTYEDFKNACERSVQKGTIIGINERLGAFVRFSFEDESFIGLLHNKDYPKGFEPKKGNTINTLITNVDVDNKKIFLRVR